MKKKLLVIAIAIVVVFSITITALAIADAEILYSLGLRSKEAREDTSGDIAATYKDRPILMSRVTEELRINELKDEALRDKNLTEKRAADLIIINMILREEAEAQGLGAAEADVRESMELLRKNAEEFPEAAAAIEAYCEGRGITVEDYWRELEEQLPGQIARGNLAKKYYEEYYKTNGIDPQSLTSEDLEKRNKSYEDYGFSLLKQHEKDIVYFIE